MAIEFLNAMDFGVKADGEKDDTEKWKEAIAAILRDVNKKRLTTLFGAIGPKRIGGL